MKKQRVLVTGASGFIGKYLVRSLVAHNYKVRAGMRTINTDNNLADLPDIELVKLDICDPASLHDIFDGVDFLYHLAAGVNTKLPAEHLYKVNVEGTRNIWYAAGKASLKKALYFSSTAVYGLLSQNRTDITEDVPAKAVEPYGRSKLLGENVVMEISKKEGLNYVIIRPAAVFGPGDSTSFGNELRTAAFSKLLLSGGFHHKNFNFVHVHDVAEAAIFLMESKFNNGNIYNIAVAPPVSYEEAFKCYLDALNKTGRKYFKVRLLGKLSLMVENLIPLLAWPASGKNSRWAFRIWKPGFDLTYSSQKLLSTSFRFKLNNFEDVIASCIDIS